MLRRRCLGGLVVAGIAARRTAAAAPGGWQSPGPVIPAVTLLDQDGRHRPLRELVRGRPAVALGFFFSACSTFCPPQTAAMQTLQAALATRADPAAPSSPLLLAVSLDPFGDTPASMRAYAERFELSLGTPQGALLLGGERRALAPVWAAFGVSGDQPETHATILWIGRDGGRLWQARGALAETEALVALLLGRLPDEVAR